MIRIRLKPFTQKSRERLCADDVRANLETNQEIVLAGFHVPPIAAERKMFLVIAEALRRADLSIDESVSRIFEMPDGIVLAVAHSESPKWDRSYLLDAECAAHFGYDAGKAL